MRLFGEEHTRESLGERTGALLQVAGIRFMQLSEGVEAGVRIADCRTGSGLRFQVTLDRGMDISLAEYRGVPLAYRSPHGDVHPRHCDPDGSSWARSFAGGLLTGCGMTQVGSPCRDGGEQLGQHGRLSTLMAEQVASSTVWEGDECLFRLEGVMREPVRGGVVRLQRQIAFHLGGSTIALNDTVINESPEQVPFMILYHCNTGWPLVDTASRLLLQTRGTTPRDAAAQRGYGTERIFPLPVPRFPEQVFYHDVIAGDDGWCSVLLEHPGLLLGLGVRYRQRELPQFVQWKMAEAGTYVLGLEPSNCLVEGRVKERDRGTLQLLAPGERRQLVLTLNILEGEHQLSDFKERYRLQ